MSDIPEEAIKRVAMAMVRQNTPDLCDFFKIDPETREYRLHYRSREEAEAIITRSWPAYRERAIELIEAYKSVVGW